MIIINNTEKETHLKVLLEFLVRSLINCADININELWVETHVFRN